jgi:hypothetical protein
MSPSLTPLPEATKNKNRPDVPGAGAIHDFKFFLFFLILFILFMQIGVDREVVSTEARGFPLNQNL